MFVSKKRLALLEKKIADLEAQIQSQHKEIISLKSQINHHVLPLDQVVQNVLKNPGNLKFQANLGNQRLFEQIIESK